MQVFKGLTKMFPRAHKPFGLDGVIHKQNTVHWNLCKVSSQRSESFFMEAARDSEFWSEARIALETTIAQFYS